MIFWFKIKIKQNSLNLRTQSKRLTSITSALESSNPHHLGFQ
jgi:hypothetical protein